MDAPPTILIVDDARINRELLRLHLAKHDYRFLTAHNGQEAIEVLSAHSEIDLILLDLIMPDMDGFDFLRWRGQHAEAQAIPVIVNSSLDDFDSIARALTMDSYDYFTKPLGQDDLEIVLPIKIRNAIKTRRLVVQTRHQNEVMRRELDMAARYQQFLLPREANLRGVEVAFLFQPCSGVGGDYFDFMDLPSGQIAFLVADVAGHGVASAMTASIVKALLPGYLERFSSPARSLLELNGDLLRLTQDDGFVTAFAGIYDPRTKVLTWCLAGHPSPIFMAKNQEPAQLNNTPSFFLGAVDSQSPLLAYADQHLAVEKGDRLLLYTDGLTEAPGKDNTFYGLGKVTELLKAHRQTSLAQLREVLWADLKSFVPGDFPDDVAFILVEF